MPWKDTRIMEQKIEFICEWHSGKHTIKELYRNFEIYETERSKEIKPVLNNYMMGRYLLLQFQNSQLSDLELTN